MERDNRLVAVCVCMCAGGLYLVGLLNALDTAQGPHSQEHSLLGTGPGSLPSMPTQPADEFRIFTFVSIIGPRDPQGLVQLPFL